MKVLILNDSNQTKTGPGEYAIDFFRGTAATFYTLQSSPLKEQPTLANERNNSADQLQEYSLYRDHHFNQIYYKSNLISALRKTITTHKIELVFLGLAFKIPTNSTIPSLYEIVRKIKCNMVLVPDKSQFYEIEKVALPVSASLLPFKGKLQKLYELSYFKNLKFTLMPIVEDREKPFPELSHRITLQFLTKLQNEFDFIVILGKNLEVIEYMLQEDIGILQRANPEIPIFIYHQLD